MAVASPCKTRKKPPNLTGYTYPVRIRRLSIKNVVFSFMRLAIARRKKDTVSPCSALLFSALRSVVLFRMAVKPLSVKNMRRTEVPISCTGLAARILNPCT